VSARTEPVGGRRLGKPAIAVVDYGAGNLTSVLKGLSAAGANPFVTGDANELFAANAIVVPGVGNFAATDAVSERMRDALMEAVSHGYPLLGICLGLQFLFDGSDEAPGVQGLRLLKGQCHQLRGDVKVPHVGWNTLERQRESPIVAGVPSTAYVYYTHSYAAPVTAATVATTTHGSPFAGVVDNGDGGCVFGVQFHPEKSGEDGMRILRNFVALC
jgi:imidazole glycerol-phosphate synthase subunit HisH